MRITIPFLIPPLQGPVTQEFMSLRMRKKEVTAARTLSPNLRNTCKKKMIYNKK